MKTSRMLRSLAAGLACLGTLVPCGVSNAVETQAARAGQQADQVAVTDVALGAGGMLSGQVLDAAGQAQSGVPVLVHRGEVTVASTMTGGDGRFVVNNLTGGVCQLSSGDATSVYRLWAANTAPPAAHSSALLVRGSNVARGQSPLGSRLAHPLIIAGIIIAAVAIPVAIHNSREDKNDRRNGS